MKNYLALFLSGLLLISCNKNHKALEKYSKDTRAIKTILNSELDKIYKNEKIIGFSVAIVNKDSILYENGFGYADIEQQKKSSKTLR